VEVILKQRLIGAAVIIALAVVLIPMILDGAGQHRRPLIPEIPKYVNSQNTDPIQVVHKAVPLPKESSFDASEYQYFGKNNKSSNAINSQAPIQAPISNSKQARKKSTENKKDLKRGRDHSTQENNVSLTKKARSHSRLKSRKQIKQNLTSTNSAKKLLRKNEVNKTQKIKVATNFARTVRKVALAWTVQIASFKNEDNANLLKSKLSKAGFNAYIQQSNIGQKKSVFRVRIGRAANQQNAKALLAKLKRVVRLNGYVTKYR